VFLVNGIYTLVDVVIVDPIQVDLVSHAALFWGVIAIVGDLGKGKILSSLVPCILVYPFGH